MPVLADGLAPLLTPPSFWIIVRSCVFPVGRRVALAGRHHPFLPPHVRQQEWLSQFPILHALLMISSRFLASRWLGLLVLP